MPQPETPNNPQPPFDKRVLILQPDQFAEALLRRRQQLAILTPGGRVDDPKEVGRLSYEVATLQARLGVLRADMNASSLDVVRQSQQDIGRRFAELDRDKNQDWFLRQGLHLRLKLLAERAEVLRSLVPLTASIFSTQMEQDRTSRARIMAAMIYDNPGYLKQTSWEYSHPYVGYEQEKELGKKIAKREVGLDKVLKAVADISLLDDPSSQLRGTDIPNKQMRAVVAFTSRGNLIDPQNQLTQAELKKFYQLCPSAVVFESRLHELVNAIVISAPVDQKTEWISDYLKSVDKTATILYGNQWLYLKHARIMEDNYWVYNAQELDNLKIPNFLEGQIALYRRLHNDGHRDHAEKDLGSNRYTASERIVNAIGESLGFDMKSHSKAIEQTYFPRDFYREWPNLAPYKLPEAQRQKQIALIRRFFEANFSLLSGEVIGKYAIYLRNILAVDGDDNFYVRAAMSSVDLTRAMDAAVAPALEAQFDKYVEVYSTADREIGHMLYANIFSTPKDFSADQLRHVYRIMIINELLWRQIDKKITQLKKPFYAEMAKRAGLKFVPGGDENNLSVMAEVTPGQTYPREAYPLSILILNGIAAKIEEAQRTDRGAYQTGFLTSDEVDQLEALAGLASLKLFEFQQGHPEMVEEFNKRLEHLKEEVDKKTGKYNYPNALRDYIIGQPGVADMTEYQREDGNPFLVVSPLLKDYYEKYAAEADIDHTLYEYKRTRYFFSLSDFHGLNSRIITLVNFLGIK